MAGGELVGEGEAEQVDEVLGEGGEVGEGAFFDLAVFPVGFAEEVAGGLAGVGGDDVHCMTKKSREMERTELAIVTSYKWESCQAEIAYVYDYDLQVLGPASGQQ